MDKKKMEIPRFRAQKFCPHRLEFCLNIFNLEGLISTYNVTIFKYEDQCLISKFKLAL